MSTSSTQQTVEETEAVKDVKGMKPLVKPKPIVPPKPKQASLSTSSEIKSPLLSPNSGGPCSPTFDIPSAFKISQLTGPQPFGVRRTSLKRWSSSVGEDVPLENNRLLSPVQNAVPESISKITTKPLTSPVKPLQTGSVWKGKSPFMLTTRGWGGQKSQEKDNHESESFSQKHNFSSVSKDADLKDKDTVLEENTVRNLSSPTRSMSTADHGGVDTNFQDPKQSLSRTSEEVEKTSFGLTSEKLEIPAQENEIKISKESSSQLSVSPQTDLYFGTTKQFIEYEHNKKYTDTERCNDKSGRETAGCTEDIYGASTEVKNKFLRTKDHEEPHVISPVPRARQKAKNLVTENAKNAETVEESPLSETPKPTAQEVYMCHQDSSYDIPELRTVIREEQDADSVYIQTSQNQIMITNQNTEQGILGKLEQVEKHDVSSGTQIANKLVTENEIYTNIPYEEKESTDYMERNLLYSPEHYDLHDEKTQVSSDDNNKPYSDEEDKMVAPTHIQSPVCTVRSHEIYSEGQQKTSTNIHDKNIEEEEELFKIAQYGNNAAIQTGKYVPHQTSDVFEKQPEYPSEYRSAFENNAKFSQDSETPSAPELPEHAHNEPSADLYVGSQILENDSMITEDVYSHPVDESKEPFHSYVEKDTQTVKPKEELSHFESYEASRPEMNYDESHFRYSKTTSQDPAARVTQPEELSDHYKQSARLEYYTAQSPILNECEVPLNKLEYKADDSGKPQYTHSQSQEQECSYSHTVETEDKQSDELVHKYGQSVDEDYKYQQLENAVYKYKQSDKPRDIYEQLEESVPRSELSNEPTYTYEQAEEPVSRYQQSEGSDLIYQQTEESDHRHQKLEDSVHKYELLEEPYYKCGESEERVHRDDQSEESVHGYKTSDKPAGTDEQSEQLVQSYQQPKTIVHKYQPSEEPVHLYEQSEEAVQKYGRLEDPSNTYEQPEESEHRYAYSEEAVYNEQLEDPDHKYKQLDELTDKHEQREHPVQGYQKLEEPIHKYETFEETVNIYKLSEEIIHSNDQSQEPDQKYNQHDEPGYSYELVNQYKQIEGPAYIHTGPDVKNSECTQSRLNNLEPHQQEFTPVQSEEMDSTPHISTASHDIHVTCPEKDIRPSEYLEQHLSDSYTVEPKYSDADEMYKEKTTEEQVHKYHQSEEQQLLSTHKEEREQSHTKSEEAQHVDGLSEGSKQESSATTTIESDESMPEETQDHPAKITYQILNGHAEHDELQTADYTSDAAKEIQADPDAEDTQAEEPSSENFDFLEGTVVLDSSFMRGRASLGKKRGHRTPAGTGAPEDQEPEYWMFRDSTDPKSVSERHPKENEKDEATPDRTPDNSPSPVKSPNKKGIFAGIISPSLLKGRLKTRSKTTEDETVRPEVEESKSPGKEKPESSSHSLNWLHGLRKKRKSSKESTKEEKKKQPK